MPNKLPAAAAIRSPDPTAQPRPPPHHPRAFTPSAAHTVGLSPIDDVDDDAYDLNNGYTGGFFVQLLRAFVPTHGCPVQGRRQVKGGVVTGTEDARADNTRNPFRRLPSEGGELPPDVNPPLFTPLRVTGFRAEKTGHAHRGIRLLPAETFVIRNILNRQVSPESSASKTRS